MIDAFFSGNLKPAAVSRRIPDGNFMAVTGSDGSRAYLSITSEDELKKKVFLRLHFCLLLCPHYDDDL